MTATISDSAAIATMIRRGLGTARRGLRFSEFKARRELQMLTRLEPCIDLRQPGCVEVWRAITVWQIDWQLGG